MTTTALTPRRVLGALALAAVSATGALVLPGHIAPAAPEDDAAVADPAPSPDDAAPAGDAAGTEDAGLDGAEVAALVAHASPSAARSAAPALQLPGAIFETAPDVAGPDAVDGATVTLSEIRDHLRTGDVHRALYEAEAFASARKSGRDRDAAWLLVGLLHREAGRHNLASEAFTRVRAGGGPLERWGAWYEAEQDLARGRASVAVSECGKYRESWPGGPQADDCLRVIARGQAALGNGAAARAAASAYDTDHPKAPIGEQIELDLALWEAQNAPQKAIPDLVHLATSHHAALTGRAAEETLAKLHDAGHADAVLPMDDASLQARAVSLRDAGRHDDAWAAYQELARRAEDEPALAGWVQGQASTFGWRCHRWDFLAELYEARYAASPNGDDAWSVMEVLGRGGRWVEAADWARKGLKDHGQTRTWAGRQEEIGHTFLLAGDYADARDMFDARAKRGGYSGRRAEFFAAFSTYLLGDDTDAVKRFTAIVDRGREYRNDSRYWRAKSYERQGKADLALSDRKAILDSDPYGWYGVLTQQLVGDRPAIEPYARNGRWPGPELPDLLSSPRVDVDEALDPSSAPVAAWAAPRLLASSAGFGELTWDEGDAASRTTTARTVAPADRDVPLGLRDLLAPPPSYVSGALFDEAAAQKAMDAYASKNGAAFDTLPAIEDLASIGLYDLSGPLMAEYYESWRKAAASSHESSHAAALTASIPQDQWRQLFLYTRDHNHTARFIYGLDRDITDPAVQLEALRLGWPLAHDRYVWAHAESNDVDPFLVLGLMRQESTYSAIALSPVGARGAMQIMPRTGHLLADLAHDTDFTAGDLEDPVLAVGYGITYMGLLMERFDGAFPLAVASYNGGPYNVSSWLKGAGKDVPMDVFVEEIPFKETRNYVKIVSSNYATYLALYAPEGTGIAMPPTWTKDDASVVDF